MEIHEQSGPILLLAGPGTGKTYRIAQRIKFLSENESISRDNITVITFTSAAARNMHDRISDSSKSDIYTPPTKQPRLICTMHSLGFKIISENAQNLGYKNSIKVISSDSARNTLIEDAAQLSELPRNEAQKTIKCRQNGDCQPSGDTKCKICEKYRQILKTCSYIDYDDQIFLANEVLKSKNDVLTNYKKKCTHLLIDEYQDINAGQFELISLLTKDQEDGLFAVGDDDQSIYSWRGGSPKYIRGFKSYFGVKAQIVPLLKSYRCPKFILESALAVVKEHDKDRLEKGTFEYSNKLEGKIKIHNVASDQKEAKWVKTIINRSLPLKKVLVLIPGRRFGSILIDQLKLSNISFYAPLNIPGEGFPLIKLLSSWLLEKNDNISLRQVLSALIANKEFGVPSSKSRKNEPLAKREEALKQISSLWVDILDGKVVNLWDSLKLNKDKDDLLKKFHSTLEITLELFNHQNNIEDFLHYITKSLKIWKNNKEFLDEVASWINITNYLSNQNSEPGVKIMTLQGAKGLEADVVCVLAMENGVLPRKTENNDNISEESRLMLVSITRAKEELHIFHARKRSGSLMYTKTFKSGKATFSKSIFIDSFPKEYSETQFHQF